MTEGKIPRPYRPGDFASRIGEYRLGDGIALVDFAIAYRRAVREVLAPNVATPHVVEMLAIEFVLVDPNVHILVECRHETRESGDIALAHVCQNHEQIDRLHIGPVIPIAEARNGYHESDESLIGLVHIPVIRRDVIPNVNGIGNVGTVT
jgi:hypothetical protein